MTTEADRLRADLELTRAELAGTLGALRSKAETTARTRAKQAAAALATGLVLVVLIKRRRKKG